jgi:hypothetical protein
MVEGWATAPDVGWPGPSRGRSRARPAHCHTSRRCSRPMARSRPRPTVPPAMAVGTAPLIRQVGRPRLVRPGGVETALLQGRRPHRGIVEDRGLERPPADVARQTPLPQLGDHPHTTCPWRAAGRGGAVTGGPAGHPFFRPPAEPATCNRSTPWSPHLQLRVGRPRPTRRGGGSRGRDLEGGFVVGCGYLSWAPP